MSELGAPLDLPKNAAKGLRIGLVVAAFNGRYTRRLQRSAGARLAELGLPVAGLTAYSVPGALELPLACQTLAASGKVDAVIAIGCVIRGETSHYDLVCQGAVQGVVRAGQATGVPVIFGVITCESSAQAAARCGGGRRDAGRHAAEAAVAMALLLRTIQKGRKAGRG